MRAAVSGLFAQAAPTSLRWRLSSVLSLLGTVTLCTGLHDTILSFCGPPACLAAVHYDAGPGGVAVGGGWSRGLHVHTRGMGMVAGASHRPLALDAARSRGDGVLLFFYSENYGCRERSVDSLARDVYRCCSTMGPTLSRLGRPGLLLIPKTWLSPGIPCPLRPPVAREYIRQRIALHARFPSWR